MHSISSSQLWFISLNFVLNPFICFIKAKETQLIKAISAWLNKLSRAKQMQGKKPPHMLPLGGAAAASSESM